MKVFLNGNYIDSDKATISPLDRGFIFGDGVYEVIPIYQDKFFRFEPHIQRLFRSLDAVQIELHLQKQDLNEILYKLIELNKNIKPQAIYLQVTRGAPPHRDLLFPHDTPITVFAYCLTNAVVGPKAEGVNAITAEDFRWHRCDIKSINLLANAMLRNQAHNQDAVEAILIHDGYVTEATSSNVFIVKNNECITPPLSHKLLAGITREFIIEVAHKNSFSCQQRAISLAELENADEIWVTSSTKEIWPVIKLDDKPVGDGKVGKVWEKMIQWFHEAIDL